jgi:hypothetical protein
MEPFWTAIIGRQLDAAMHMFEEVIQSCPEDQWTGELWTDKDAPPGLADFWYLAYHTLFWLDLYMSGAVEGFAPPEPYNLDELDPAGLIPERVYTPAELLAYLEHCRQKAHRILNDLTDEQARRLCAFPWGEIPYAELLADNIRHVQEHGAQLRMFLGQQAGFNPRWYRK